MSPAKMTGGMVHYAVAVFIFFFFYRSGGHRGFHSFPTRRSSDLGIGARGVRVVFGQEAVDDPARAGSSTARSEEHTSELQSLAYLVCRLLLEKKKLHEHMPGHVLYLPHVTDGERRARRVRYHPRT